MLLGCNYIPSNAINSLEMWQKETFSPFLIDQELGWAAQAGLNTLRVFLHDLLWKHDPDGLLDRMEVFLKICKKHHIKPLFVFFDSVWNPDPQWGSQPDPIPHRHNPGWVQSPGSWVLNNPATQGYLEDYVKTVVTHFDTDHRVLGWDLFNEPCNTNTGSYNEPFKATVAFGLLQKAVTWMEEIKPRHFYTTGVWAGRWEEENLTDLDRYILETSPVLSFHCYGDAAEVEARIQVLQRYGKPLLCTEYMARPVSTFASILPVFKKYGVGAYHWGLVQGKTQTHCSWASWNENHPSAPTEWFHDLFHPDGTPYCPKEIAQLQAHQKNFPSFLDKQRKK